jgi:hypothetical protein
MSTTSTRNRKPKLPGKPAPGTQVITCTKPGCGREYPSSDDRPSVELAPGAGDYRAVKDAARRDGWQDRADHGWLCAVDRDHVPWWPGPPLLAALPARVPGATRAEFLGVVRDVPAALPAPPDVPRPAETAHAVPPRPGDTQVLPVLPHRHPGAALAHAQADDQAQHDATMLLVRSGADPADIAALAAPEPGEDTP